MKNQYFPKFKNALSSIFEMVILLFFPQNIVTNSFDAGLEHYIHADFLN